MALVLVVDDQPDLCSILGTLLRDRCHEAQCVPSGEGALAAVAARRPDLVLLDLHLGGIDGFETLRRLQQRAPGVPVVMMTAFGDVSSAVRAMKLGATDFLTKPFDNRALLDGVDRLLSLRRCPGGHADGPETVGESPAFRKARELALQFAVPDINVLLLGETGAGKEVLARVIHAASKRWAGPFVALDCSTLPETLIESELFGHEKGSYTGATATTAGRFESAQGGTLFLDEIANLSPRLQAKLLRVLQDRRTERIGGRESIRLDVRVLSAMNVDPTESIRSGALRQDLYFRLNEMAITLPPLRERGGDVRLLAEHFVRRFAGQFGRPARRLSADTLGLLDRYRWPGNVRELESALKSAVILAEDVVLPEHLPPGIRAGMPAVGASNPLAAGETSHRVQIDLEFGGFAGEIDLKALGLRAAEEAERSLMVSLMRRERCTGTALARLLRVDPKTLRAKLRKYGLDKAG